VTQFSVDPFEFFMFDLDGTLVDSVPGLFAAIQGMLSALDLPKVTSEQVDQWVGNGADSLIRRALAGHMDGDQFGQISNALFQQAKAAFIEAYHRHLLDGVQLYPGVLKALRQFRQLQKPMAVVTNKPRQFTQPLLQQLQLEPFFDVVLSGDSLPTKKPSPEPLYAVADRFDCQITAGLMVGDSVNDVQAARNAECAIVAVNYGYNHGQPIANCCPDVVVSDLCELFLPSSALELA